MNYDNRNFFQEDVLQYSHIIRFVGVISPGKGMISLDCSVSFTSVTMDNFDCASPTAESLFERIALKWKRHRRT